VQVDGLAARRNPGGWLKGNTVRGYPERVRSKAVAAPATVSGERFRHHATGELLREGGRDAPDPRARRPAIKTDRDAGRGAPVAAGLPQDPDLPGRIVAPEGSGRHPMTRAARAFAASPPDAAEPAPALDQGPVTEQTLPHLHVCVTCRAGRDLAPDETPPGAQLHAALAARLAGQAAEGIAPVVELREVTCLAACGHGCTAALAAPGKWTMLLGNLNAGLAEDLLTYGATYAASERGTVLPSRRPASLRDIVLGRVPAPEENP
jgi:predicted metal-binding protein